MRNTNLRLQGAPLSPSFRGSPAEFFAEIIRLLRIVSPDGYYGIVVSDIEPESNQGLWLKDGTKPYVWSDDEARYVPADITDGIATQLTQLADLVSKMAAGRVIFAQLEPGETERSKVLWVQIGESGAVISMRVWDAAAEAWRLLPGTNQYTVSSTGVTDDQYKLTLDDPASLGQLVGTPIVVRWHRTSTGPVTIVVSGLPTAANLIDSSSGQQVNTSGVREGQVSVLVYDGTVWQMATQPAGGAPHGVQLITATGDGEFTVPERVYSIKATVTGGGGGGGFGSGRKGGGGGGTCVKVWSVTPGQVLGYAIGTAGAKESGSGAGDATNGGDTTFNGSQIGRGGQNGGTGTAAGGSHLGGDYGIDGRAGTFEIDQGNRVSGGRSAFPGSESGMTTGPGAVVSGRLGGGGVGDIDPSGSENSDGGAGAILLEW